MMKYQLVIQFPEELYGDLDWIIDMEDRLEELLTDAEVDGHDIGSGEVNIFIHTNNPMDTFKRAKDLLKEVDVVTLQNMKIAYRKISDEQYHILWPQNLTTFKVT